MIRISTSSWSIAKEENCWQVWASDTTLKLRRVPHFHFLHACWSLFPCNQLQLTAGREVKYTNNQAPCVRYVRSCGTAISDFTVLMIANARACTSCFTNQLRCTLQVASYMRAVLRTLVQCHAKRILHRDIKPGNFMLLEDHPLAPVKAIGIMRPLPLQIPLKHSHFKHGCVKACLHGNEVYSSFNPQDCTELAKN